MPMKKGNTMWKPYIFGVMKESRNSGGGEMRRYQALKAQNDEFYTPVPRY